MLFGGGLAIIAYEVRFSTMDRPWLYGVALVMMGLVSPEVVLSIAESIASILGVRRNGK